MNDLRSLARRARLKNEASETARAELFSRAIPAICETALLAGARRGQTAHEDGGSVDVVLRGGVPGVDWAALIDLISVDLSVWNGEVLRYADEQSAHLSVSVEECDKCGCGPAGLRVVIGL